MSRHILITNDDGIGAEGIRKLAEIARGFGEVTVVAPDTQRSAASHHCIFSRPLILKEYNFGLYGVKAFTLDGTPADCVRVGIFAASDIKPDIVLSGINHGYNISSDIQYSGTVGAALEAAFLGGAAPNIYDSLSVAYSFCTLNGEYSHIYPHRPPSYPQSEGCNCCNFVTYPPHEGHAYP